MNTNNYGSRSGRLRFRADDPALTPYAGLGLVGELSRRTRLVEILDGEIASVRGAEAIKVRRRGVTPGALVMSLAECQVAGADCFDDVEDVRSDQAGAPLRAVAGTPAASTARQLAQRFRPAHIHALERAAARVSNQLDRDVGRDPGDPVTLDLDGTETEVYGHGAAKRGVGRSHTGALAYESYVVTWAQRGRALCCDLQPGNRARISAKESFALLKRAEALLPEGHGQITVRIDSGFYSVELMSLLRAAGMRFTVSAPRTSRMWEQVREIPDNVWGDAQGMHAQVAESTFQPAGWKHEPLRLLVRRVPVSAAEIENGSPAARRRSTIPACQLQMVIDGSLASTWAYSFIATDIPAAETDTVQTERFHRWRAQIEERFKDAKLGQPLRHLPSGDLNANRVWLATSLLALNLTAMICDLCPAAGASGQAPDRPLPLRRHAKTLRRILLCVPARLTRNARQLTMHFRAGFRYLNVFQETYRNITALNSA